MNIVEKIVSSPILRESLGKIVLAIIILFASIVLVNVIIKTLKKILYKGDHQPKKRTLFTVLSSLVKYIIYFITLMIVLEIFGIKTSSIVAVAGVGSVALGFGAQVLVEDMISGLFILAENQFNIGDYITVANYSGTVEEMSLRTTALRTASGELCIVPNGEIRGVRNFTKDYMNAMVELPVPYAVSVDKLLSLLEENLKNYFVTGQTMESPKVLGVSGYGATSLTVLITCKCHPGQNWTVERDLRQYLLNVLAKEGIEIPHTTKTVHVASRPGDQT